MYEVAELVVDDERFELRMGTERFWGYAPEAVVSSTAPLGGIAMRVSPGDTIRFATVRSSASGSTRVHGITVPELGVDIELAPGESRDRVEIVVCELGTYAIDDYRDPGSHAYADIIVEERPEPVVATADPVVYEIHTIVVEDGLFELQMGEAPYWGYGGGERISSNEGDGVLITVKVGDTLNVGTVRRAGSRTTKLHFFTIEALGIDHAMVSGGSIEPLVLEFTEAGTIIVDDSSDPGEHGVFKIVVEPAGVGPTVYEIHTIVVEDGLFELQMGDAPYWGYGGGERIPSNEGDGVLITVKVGDTLNVGTVRRAGSRTTKLHFFTIEALGIDHAMVSGGSIEPLVLEFTDAGTIIVDDSSDPGEHGVFKIIVEP